MKKIIALFAVLAFMLNITVAQEATKPKNKAEAKKEVRTEKKAEKAEKAEKAKKEQKAPVADEGRKAEGDHLKKDGTPDKRYKENKQPEKEVTGPTKKDGTPDMRYKENKKTEEKKK